MAAISASMVKELRDRTGLGMMECKKALKASDGDVEQAIDDLRKASGLKASKKAGRTAAEGVVGIKVSDSHDFAALVEVNSETDFVARDASFLGFVEQVVGAAFEQKQDNVEALMAGDLETAREALVQKIGENISVRRISLVTADAGGKVGAYVHSNVRIGVLTQLSAGDAELARDVAMHVAASNPQSTTPDDMPKDMVAREEDVIKAQPDMQGKPEAIVEKMMAGRIKKFLQENSLTEQQFVKDPDVTVGELAKKSGAVVQGFVRFEVGEGIEVEKVDFAAEVAAQVQASQ